MVLDVQTMAGIENSSRCRQQKTVNTSEVVSRCHKLKKRHKVEVFSNDYVCTEQDECIIEYIASQTPDKVLVDVDGAVCTRENLQCLFDCTSHVGGDVLSAYIHLIRAQEHLLHRDGRKIIGLQRHIDIVAKKKELKNQRWRDLRVSEWPVVEKITTPVQKDGSSCGLFMINYMEYWTGTQLSDNVTQNDMENFRLKLIAILWDSELNTMKPCPDSEPDDNKGEESSSEVEILDKAPNALKWKAQIS
ncbi:hypothetical protein U9M48_008838 [Paspalum notatum var. saurae]|uniref:Ubiquitin-like protease family profile domain-containing protein n=1 Tax=Paspalum notatum var. saurae TaxID=547442 RepID=A0AAQ3SPT8_PASNO